MDPSVEAETPPPARRRRFGRWVLAAVVLVLVVSGVSYATTYQPLVRGDFGLGPKFENAKLPDPSSRVLPYIVGAPVLWGFSIRNGGPLPVTVNGVEWRTSKGPLGNVSFLVTRGDLSVAREIPGALDPMHPFTLAHGEQAMIVLRAVLSGCTVPPVGVGRNTIGVYSLSVDFRALGISHTTTIPDLSGGGFQIAVPTNAVCS
jgi:hypothetical protein